MSKYRPLEVREQSRPMAHVERASRRSVCASFVTSAGVRASARYSVRRNWRWAVVCGGTLNP